jgi:hypothetical protein
MRSSSADTLSADEASMNKPESPQRGLAGNYRRCQISRKSLLKPMGAESERGQQGGRGGVVPSRFPGERGQGSALEAAGEPLRLAIPMFQHFPSAGLRSWGPITKTGDLESPLRGQLFTCNWDRQPAQLAYIEGSVDAGGSVPNSSLSDGLLVAGNDLCHIWFEIQAGMANEHSHRRRHATPFGASHDLSVPRGRRLGVVG